MSRARSAAADLQTDEACADHDGSLGVFACAMMARQSANERKVVDVLLIGAGNIELDGFSPGRQQQFVELDLASVS